MTGKLFIRINVPSSGIHSSSCTVPLTMATSNRSYLLVIFLFFSVVFIVTSFPYDPIKLRLDSRSIVFHRDKLNWFKAAEACRKERMQLLSIQSAAENIEVANHGKFLDIHSLWIAASDLAESGRWMWFTTGEPVTDTFWSVNETFTKDNNCVEVQTEDGRWMPRVCYFKKEYACEEVIKKDNNGENRGFWKTITDFFMGLGK